jgi:glycosyltransferase involved in cell wall biosynthesis
MKISIIIPVYHVSAFIGRCLDSVLEQDYEDMECIFVDDASPDNSMNLVENRLSDYKGSICFRLLHHAENKGLSAARNTGIREATGEYLFFLDGDDALRPHSISFLAELATIYEAPDMVQGSSLIQDGNRFSSRYMIRKSVPEYCRKRSWIRKQMLRRKKIPVTAWNKLIKRSFLVENHLFFKEGIWHEDEHWTFFAASCVQSVAFCRLPSYEHYLHRDSFMANSGKRSVDSWFVILDDFIRRSELKGRLERKTIMELLFCQLVRILNGDLIALDENIARLRWLAKPCLMYAWRHLRFTEALLLSVYSLPLSLLKTQRLSILKAIYFRMLMFFV